MGRRKRIARNVVQMGPDKLARVCEQSPVLAQIDPLKRRSRQLEQRSRRRFTTRISCKIDPQGLSVGCRKT